MPRPLNDYDDEDLHDHDDHHDPPRGAEYFWENEVLRSLRCICHELSAIRSVLTRFAHHPVSLHFTLTDSVTRKELPMPIQLVVGQTVIATPTETDAQGNSVAIVPANMSWSSSDQGVASFVANSDGTATFTAIAPGTSNVDVADTAFNLTASPDVITVVAATDNPTAIAFTFGTAQGSSTSSSAVAAGHVVNAAGKVVKE